MPPFSNKRIVMSRRWPGCCLGVLIAVLAGSAGGFQEHAGHGVKPPKLFLDKNPRIVAFQLQRLDNQRLLLAERSADDPKYLPVHAEILKREGIPPADREAALAAMVTIKDSSPVLELLEVIATTEGPAPARRRIIDPLTALMLKQPPEALSRAASRFAELATGDEPLLQTIGMAGLLTAGLDSQAEALVDAGKTPLTSFLEAVARLPDATRRNSFEPTLLTVLKDPQAPAPQKQAALRTLRTLNTDGADRFSAAAPLVAQVPLRREAVRTLLAVDRSQRPATAAEPLAIELIEMAEAAPAAQRTEDEFLEAMQLADQLLAQLDVDRARQLRKRLGEVSVRVVLVHTVEEEMRYDVPWFAVEAGRDVQIVFNNEDLMPHNLVITQPGKLQEVALAGAAEGPRIGSSGKQYVPDSPDVLFATEMVPANGQSRLTFVAPREPGEYPFVCTFPGHWMRMYGVMVVVPDLTAFERAPVTPADPIGSNRAFVKAWTMADFPGDLTNALRGRTPEIGKKLFAEATCATCHRVQGEGKQVGPDLTEVWSRWKGQAPDVLREVLEPSHRIEPQYVVRKIITLDGDVLSGIVVSEDAKSISLLANPESPETTEVAIADIEEMVQSSVSLMPKALLDRFTEDEILELLAYLRSVQPEEGPEAP